MNEENMSKENITDNKPAAEPRFKVGDVVWSPRAGTINGHPMFMECRILALHYIWADGESVFSGYRLIDDDNSHSHKSETVFATKEQCEAFVGNIIATKMKEPREGSKTKEPRESSKMEAIGTFLKKLGELMDKESNEEEK